MCVEKTARYNVVPARLDTITVQTPSLNVLTNAMLPLVVNGYDAYGNNVGQLLDEFIISVDA